MRGLQATTTKNESSATEIEEQEQNNTTSNQIKLHLHQGRFIRIDHNFVFPKRLYYFRNHVKDTEEDIPPLKLLDSKSIRHIKRGKSSLSDLTCLIGVLEQEANMQVLMTIGISGQ